MRKPAFCIFLWPLCSDIIFFIDHYCAGVSNKHCLLPFFHFSQICNSLTTLDRCQNFVSAQYLENEWTELDQILYIYQY